MSPAALSARRIGEILCEKGLLTQEQLEDALAEQERTERRFGEILLERGLVSRLALASALAEQWATLEGEHATVQSTAAEEGEQVETLEAIEEEWQALRGRHRPIGEIFVAGGLISQEQLDRALEEQKRSGQRLGEVLVAHGAVSRLELASALAEQWAARPRLRLAEDEPAAGETVAKENGAAPAPKNASIAHERIEELAGRLEQHDESFLSAAQELESRLAGLEQLVTSGRDDDATRSELEELRRSLAELRERELDVTGIGRDELESVLETRIGPLDERLTSFGEAAERLGADLRGAVERLGVRLDQEANRLEDVASRHAREAAEARLAEEAAARATIEAAVEERLAALEELTALSGEDRRIVELASDLADLRSAVHALTDQPATASFDAAPLEDRIGALEERLTHQREADEARGHAAASALEQLRDRIDTQAHEAAAALEQRLGELAARLAERDQAARAEESAQLEQRLAALQSQLAELSEAEQALDGSLATALQEIQEKLHAEARRLEKLASEHADAGFDTRLAELEQRIAAGNEEHPRLAELATEVAQLGSELDALRNREQALDGPLEEIEARLETRFAELEQRVSAGGEDDAQLADLSAEVAQLGNELDALRNAERSDDELRARVAELEGRLTDLSEAERALDDPLEEIQAKLDARLAELEQRFAAGSEEDPRLAELTTEVAQLAGELRNAERPDEELRARVAELEGRLGEAAEAGVTQLRGELEQVRHELDAVRKEATGDEALERLDELEAKLTALREAEESPDGSTAAALEQLTAKLEAESARLEELATERLGAALEERLAEVERHLTSADETSGIDALAAELADVRGAVEALSTQADRSEELLALEAKVEELQTAHANSNQADDALRGSLEAAVEELHAKVAEASDAVASAADARIAELERLVAARATTGKVEKLAAEVADLRRALGENSEGVTSEALEALVLDLEERSQSVTDDLRKELEALGGHDDRLGELERASGEAGAGAERLAAELAQVREALAELHARGEVTGERLEAELDDRLGALGKRLGKIEKTISAAAEQVEARVAEAESRQHDAAEQLAASLQSRIDDVESRLGQARDTIAAEARDIVQALRSELDQALRDATAELGSRVDGVAELSAEREQALGERVEQRVGELQTRLEELGGAEERIRSELQAALERAIGRLGAQLGESEKTLAETARQVETGVAELGARQAAAQEALTAAFEGRLAELEGRLAELGQADERVLAEVQSALESRLGRLARRILENEQTLSTAAEQIQSRVEVLEEGLGSADSSIARIDDLSVAAGELQRAVNDLGERVDGHVAGALAALADWQPRPTMSIQSPVNGSKEPEAAAPPSTGFVAFVPTGKGYKLVELDGVPPPAVGAELDLPGVSGRLTVAKLGASPLANDRRPCAYLEESPSLLTGPDSPAPTR